MKHNVFGFIKRLTPCFVALAICSSVGVVSHAAQVSARLGSQAVRVKPPGKCGNKLNVSCELIVFNDGKNHEPITVRSAKNLEKCEKPHYKIKTSNMSQAMESFRPAVKTENPNDEKNPHVFELESLFAAYSCLLKDDELIELKVFVSDNEKYKSVYDEILLYRRNLFSN